MQIYFKKGFIKQYGKLIKSDRLRVDRAFEAFEKNPQGPKLRNHALVGKLAGKRAISAGFDLRIIFETEKDYLVVVMVGVGTHSQVY